MNGEQRKDPEIVTYRIPRIEVYQVTDDELKRMEEGCSQVSQDLTFAVAFISFSIAFLITLFTAKLSELQQLIFTLISVVCGIVSFYTGLKWLRTRKTMPNVIANIRSRKDTPDVTPGEDSSRIDKIEAGSTQMEIVFSEVFDYFEGWEQYLEGRVSHSKEVSPHIGQFCLKKEHRNDPHGGYKIIGKSIGLGFIFSGWLFRPSGKPGGQGDRLAIEDMEFNGYGFLVDHGANFAVIERRGKGIASEISKRINFNPPQDAWYQFEFHSSSDGKFELCLNNSQGEKLVEITAVDSIYNQFDRIVIHGGQPYFVDDIKIIKV